MNAMRLCAMASLLLVALAAPAIADESDPREKLETAIPEAIRLLEAKEYETMLKQFVRPDDLELILQTTTLEKLAEGFAGEKSEKLLQALKQIEDTKPMLDESGKIATYTLKEKVGGKMTLVFEKVDKFWYIAN